MIANKSIIILIAEDDDEDYLLTRKAFSKGTLVNALFRVKNGEELLRYLSGKREYTDRKAFPIPDLILLDLNMPVMDGREALQRIKSDPRWIQIPICVLTTSRADEDIVKSYELGVNSFLRKPIKYQDFVEKILWFEKYWFQIVELPR